MLQNVSTVLPCNINNISHMEHPTIKGIQTEKKVIKLQFTYLQRILKRQLL